MAPPTLQYRFYGLYDRFCIFVLLPKCNHMLVCKTGEGNCKTILIFIVIEYAVLRAALRIMFKIREKENL